MCHFLDELGGLAEEALVHWQVRLEGGPQQPVHLRQASEVVDVRAEERVRGEDLVQLLDFPVEAVEALPLLGVAERLDDRLHLLVAREAVPDAEELGACAFHQFGEADPQHLEVFDDAGDILGVERQRFLEVLEDPYVVDDEAVLFPPPFVVFVGTVHPGYGLE